VPGLPDRQGAEVLGLGILSANDEVGALGPPPRLGEHTEEILDCLSRA